MRAADRLRMKGRVRFLVHDHGSIIRCEEVDNLIVNAWLNRMRDAFIGTVSDLTIRELAWGSSNTAPAVGQTALVAEIARKAVTQKTAPGTGEVLITTYVGPGEANAQLEEWALFGGTPGSLGMVSRVLWSHLKTASESIQADWSYTIAEAP